MKNKSDIIILLIVLISLPHVSTASSEPMEKHCRDGIERSISEVANQGKFQVMYEFSISEDMREICIDINNMGEYKALTGLRLTIDGESFSPDLPELKPGESQHTTQNITEVLDTTQVRHTLTVGAYDENFQFNFTRKLNESSPEVPSPYISDVDVVRDQDNDSTELVASVHNPGERAYGGYLQAVTFGTSGEFEVIAPQPGNTTEHVLPLDEYADEVVAGKVRFYSGNRTNGGKFDQKEFMSESNGTTEAWDDRFDQIPESATDDSYENETARQHRAGYVDDEALSPLQRRAGAVLVVVFVVGAWWRRRRR